ncbi:MAG: FAD-binding protein [Coriobacteriales bacterium]|jgi:fumarate reductase flavoprotein subunit
MIKDISRRAFVQDAGLATLGVTALSAIAGPALAAEAPAGSGAPDGSAASDGAAAPAGGAGPAMGAGPHEDPDWRTAPEAPAASEVVETYDCDVLVIGLGHAGCTALRAAAEAGAKVAAFEDQDEDSMSFLAGGQVGHINSEFLGSRGVPQVDTIDFINDWQRRSNNRSNPGLVRNYAEYCGDAFDWLIDCLSDDDRQSMTIRQWPYEGGATKTSYSGIDCWVGTANLGSFQSTVLQNCIDVAVADGGKVYYGTSGYLLTQDADGKVTGAYGKRDDGYVQVNAAKGVVLATGDFSTNSTMCADLLTEINALLPKGGSISCMGAGRDGQGIKMGYWAGGRIDPCMSTMDGAYWYPTDSPTDPIGTTAALWINADGKRYSNEGFGSTELAGMPGSYQPAGIISTVFDSKIIDQVKVQPLGHMSYDYANQSDDQLQQTLDAAYESYKNGEFSASSASADADAAATGGATGNKAMMGGATLYAADTLEELAGFLGYAGDAADNFVATVKRYNEMCAQGYDEDFGKDPALLFPVDEPPYYGYSGTKAIGVIMVTTSGLVVDEDSRVLGDDYRPIEGLFAAGNNSGCRFGYSYFTSIAGQSLSFAETQGYMAGTFAATGALPANPKVVHLEQE